MRPLPALPGLPRGGCVLSEVLPLIGPVIVRPTWITGAYAHLDIQLFALRARCPADTLAVAAISSFPRSFQRRAAAPTGFAHRGCRPSPAGCAATTHGDRTPGSSRWVVTLLCVLDIGRRPANRAPAGVEPACTGRGCHGQAAMRYFFGLQYVSVCEWQFGQRNLRFSSLLSAVSPLT